MTWLSKYAQPQEEPSEAPEATIPLNQGVGVTPDPIEPESRRSTAPKAEPGGGSWLDRFKRAAAQAPEAQPRPAPESYAPQSPRDPSEPSYLSPKELGKSLGRGVLGARTAIGETIGEVGRAIEEKSQRAQEEGAQAARPLFEFTESLGEEVQAFFPRDAPPLEAEALTSGRGDGPNVADMVAESLPNFLTTIGATAVGGIPAGAATAGSVEWGYQYRQARERGADDVEARTSATIYTGAAAALEQTGAMKTLEKVFPKAGKRELADLGARVFGSAAAEGVTESAQEIASETADLATFAGEQGFGIEDLKSLVSPENVKQYGLSGLVGAITGGGVTAATAPFTRTTQEAEDAQGIQPREQPQGQQEPGAVEVPPEVRPVEPREGDLEGAEARPLEGREAEPGAEALDPALRELAEASQAIGASQPTEVRATRVEDTTPEGEVVPVRTLEAYDDSGNRVGGMTFSVEDGGFRVSDVETVGRGTGGMRMMMERAEEIAGGPYQGSFAETAEGEGALATLEAEKKPPETFKEFVEQRGVEWENLTPQSPEYEGMVQEFRRQKDSSPDDDVPTIVERVAPKGDEAGFIESPANLRKDIDTFIRRQLAPRGNLPESAWRLKLQKGHNVASHEKGVEYRLREMQKLIRGYDGPLTDKQLARYLGDALRGYVPLRIRAETSSADRIQIARIARNRGLTEEQVAEEFASREEDPEGLALAPEFAGIISKLRADIDGITRGLRREGLLDDASARELERSHGLYVHRTYEAFRGKSKQYLDRVRKEPLWNRAKEILLKEHPDYTESEVDGLLAEMIDRDERPTLPGNVPEGAKNRSTLFQRRSVRDLERLLLGERRDLRAQAVDTLIGQASLLEHHRFLKALREDGLGKYLFERPRRGFHRPIDESVTALPVMEEEGQPGLIYRKHGSGRYDPVGQLRTSPEILQELKDATPSVNDMAPWMKIWMMGNLAVKLNLTAGSIQTQMRNPESNIFPMITNGYLPVGEGATEALSLIAKDLFHSSDDAVRSSLMRFRTMGVTDQNADYGDLRRLGKFADLLRVEQDPGARPVHWVKEVVRKTGQMYSNGDNLAKILGFYKERLRLDKAEPEWKNQPPQNSLLRDADPSISRLDEEAAARVKETLQNYAELPRLARAVSANPVVAPFFSFTYAMARGLKNTAVRTSQEVLSDNPKMRKIGYKRAVGIAIGLSLPEVLSNAFGWYSNTDDEDREALKEFVYPWDKNANLGIVHHEPGRYVYFNWGFMDYFSKIKEPFYAAHRAMTTNIPPEQIASGLLDDYNEEVLFGAIVDSLRGETASGWEVWMDNDTRAVKIKKSLEHLWETGRPGIERTRERITEAVKGDRALWTELVAILGPRVTDVDVPERLNRFGGAFTRAIGQATRQYSQYAHRRDRPEREDLLRGYARANEVRRELIQELRRKIDAGTKSGLTINEVERALLDGGLPQKYFDLALEGPEGEIPPLDYERGPHWREFEKDLRRAQEEER